MRLKVMRRRSLFKIHVLFAFRRCVLSLIACVDGQLGKRVVHMRIDDTEGIPIVLIHHEIRMVLIDMFTRAHHLHKRFLHRQYLGFLLSWHEVSIESVEPLFRIYNLSPSRDMIHKF